MVAGEYPPMKGGVGRYSHNLVEALRKRGNDVIVAARSGQNFDAGALGIIKKGDRANSDRLLKLVADERPDVVNIQYERGLYEVDTTIRHTASRFIHGSTLDKFYRQSPVPVVSTLHTVFPYDEYQDYIKERVRRKDGRFRFLPLPLRVAVRRWVMKRRYDLLLQVVNLSSDVISPANTIKQVVNRGTVIYHGAQPAVPAPAHKDALRKEFGLPADRMLMLAFGYVGSYKGFDILDNLELPDGWSLVVKQTTHERGTEKPVAVDKKGTISLHLGYLDDATMSKLFFACDAIVFPYRVVSISGVMFDALAHGLPFVASDLEFFKEFAALGLGITCSRDAGAFSRSIHALAENYPQYRQNVQAFAPRLAWDNIAGKHIAYYSKLISKVPRNVIAEA